MTENFSIKSLFEPSDYNINQALDYCISDFLAQSDEVGCFNKQEIDNFFSTLKIPENTANMDDYIKDIKEIIIPMCSHLANPSYLGHMTSPLPWFIPQIGRLIQSLNQNMVKMETSRGLTLLERQLLRLLHQEIFHFNDDFYFDVNKDFSKTTGIFTSGGTMANLTAMWGAVSQVKQSGVNKIAVIGSELMHYSFDKASSLLGVELYRIPVDHQNQIVVTELEQQIKKCRAEGMTIAALVAIAGTTDFGSIDPLHQIAELGRKYHIHVHVDAAWAGAFILSKQHVSLLSGLERADSVTIDGHKQMFMPIGTGMLFFKDPQFSQNIVHTAPYAVRRASLDQGRFTLEGTRPANMLYLHACLHLIGKNGYDEIFSVALNNIKILAKHIQENPCFELLNDPKINILSYRYIPRIFRNKMMTPEDNIIINHFNYQLQKEQRNKGKSFVSRSIRKFSQHDNQELVFLRVVILNPNVNEEHMVYMLEDQIEIAKQLESYLMAAS